MTEEEKYLIKPFFTNLDKSVFAVTFLPPEVIGALCSRTSRAKDDLREILLNEFIKPFVDTNDKYGESLKALIDFLHKYPIELIFSNPKGRDFYIKWLAQFGDDSIAQMAGTHLIYTDLSQIAIKHFEDMRIGIAPIEKSTRYVDYSSKINGKYRYYVDPRFKEIGLMDEYIKTMDCLFDAYSSLLEKYFNYLKSKYPNEKESLLKTKTFDVIRKILPVSVLSQVSFYGNGQAFEYLINRSLNHNLTEIRKASKKGLEELKKVIPAFLRRAETEEAQDYQKYLSGKGEQVKTALKKLNWQREDKVSDSDVKLLDYDPDGENKVIAGLLYNELHQSFNDILQRVRSMSIYEKEGVLNEVFSNRKYKYYKVPRALENTYLRFEVAMNIGAWRDLHRHRMLTQYREKFSIYNGFDVSPELIESGLDKEYVEAIKRTEELFKKVEAVDPELAQYCCTLAHRVRFIQYQNLRNFFWETELRTIPEGHPDYRKIEHQKINIVKNIFPTISKHLLVDMNDYDFARRKVTDQIKKKEAELKLWNTKQPSA